MTSNEPSNTQPTVITLDSENSVQIICQYVELAQQKGAFLLQEAEILKRAADVLLNGAQDKEINAQSAKGLLIQGIHKGQRHGAYTLNDAALLSKVVQFVTANPQPQVSSEAVSQPPADNAETAGDDDDLTDLADPIPLRPKEV